MKNAKIKLVSVITADGAEEKTEYTVFGCFCISGGTVTVKYTEPAQSGMGAVETLLTVLDGKAEIHRSGGTEMKMVISRGKTFPAVYKTPYGELSLETKGIEACFKAEDGGAEIILVYDLCSAGETLSTNKLILNIREV